MKFVVDIVEYGAFCVDVSVSEICFYVLAPSERVFGHGFCDILLFFPISQRVLRN
jgi:hypothetical protein